MLRLRSALYMITLIVTVMPYAIGTLLWSWLPQRQRYKMATLWTRLAIWAARAICGIDYRVEGWENLPDGPAITLPKITSVEQVAAMVWLVEELEQRLDLPEGRLRFELQIETPQSILLPDGTVQPLPALPWGERGRPAALASDAAGQLAVLDGKSGEIVLLDAGGTVRDRVPAPASDRDVPVALALDPEGALEVVTGDGRLRRSP